MTTPRRLGPAQPQRQAAHLAVSVGAAIVGLTGVWLWWFGESQSLLGAANQGDLTDRFTMQLWIRRTHLGAAIALAVVVAGMLLEALVRRHGWRAIFLSVFGCLLGAGFWTGAHADWREARLWASTIGSRADVLGLGGGPPLPDDLGFARGHLAIVPAALAIVALASFWHSRQR